MITMDFSITSVGNHPQTPALIHSLPSPQLSMVKLSPAPSKVTYSLTSSPEGDCM